MKKLVLLIVFALVMCTVGCAVAAKVSKAPIVIGAIFSITGDNAPLGVPERDTAVMLTKQVNAKGGIKGRPVKLEVYDDGGKPEQAVQACNKLLARKDVVAIIGPTLTGPSLAIAGMCNRAKMPLISCAASVKITQPVLPYVFKTAQTDSLAVEKLIDYLKKHKISRVGFINDSNAFGASGREQWLIASKKAGIKTVALESFNSGDTDMTSQLTKIRSAKPQAVVCWGTNPGPAIVAKNMRALGMKQPLFMSHGVSNPEFIKLAGSAAEGVIFPSGKIIVADAIPASDPQKRVLMQYAADFKKTYNKPASHFGGHAWDAFQLVVHAVGKVGTDRVKIRDAIENTKRFVGIGGVFSFSPKDHAGLTKDAFVMVQVRNGKWTLAK
ncbi:MAG: ABC transporter substrate-binding protein [Armatimonadota bacterium]|nr:ABC transporter substrate-binding protein [Armatimonadota bacterium]